MYKSDSIAIVVSLGLLGALSGTDWPARADNVASPPAAAASSRTFAPADLRGYGAVSGSFRLEAGGSVLEITCEDESKAKLLQAKYLSDLAELPGVNIEAGRNPTAYAVEGQGSVAAFRAASKVTILAAAGDEELKALIQQVKPAGDARAEVEPPMYLDRWDKFGFRHYYRVWHPPPG
jgi:hypothetical protein